MPPRRGHAATFRTIALLASAVTGVELLAAWHPAVPVSLRLAALGLAATTAVRPTWGLFVLLALAPVAMPLSVLSGAPFGGAQTAELLVAAFLFAASLRAAFEPPTEMRLFLPAVAFGFTALAAAAVQLASTQWVTAWPGDFAWSIATHLSSTYFLEPDTLHPLHPLMRVLGSLWLAVVAERLLRSDPAGRSSGVTMFLLGATAAALFAVYRLMEISARTGEFWTSAAHYLLTERLNPHFADINAAGSYYALAGVAALWLAVRTRTLPAVIAAPVVLLGLWLTGSRAALAAAVVSVGLVGGARFFRRTLSGQRLLWASAGLLVVATLVTVNPGRRQAAANEAFGIRWELTLIGLQLAAEHPLTGIGLGTFRDASRDLISPALVAQFPNAAGGENAHNNFLQILVELGLVGLAAFLWLVAAAIGWQPFSRPAVPARGAPDRAAIESAALAAGLVAFLLTCLLGHPLLTPQVRFAFFLALGLAAAGIRPVPGNVPSWPGRAATAIVIIVLVSLPFRWRAARAEISPSAFPVGSTVTEVRTEDDVRYVEIAGRTRWWLDPEASVATLLLRLPPGSPIGCTIAIEVDGRESGMVAPAGERWTTMRVALGAIAGPTPKRIDLVPRDASCRVWVGAIDAARPGRAP